MPLCLQRYRSGHGAAKGPGASGEKTADGRSCKGVET